MITIKNKRHHAYTGGSVTLAMTVLAGTKSGDIVKFGTAGLYGVAETDRVTTEQAAKGTGPQGYVEGQAGVYLPGITLTLMVPAAALTGIADFAKVSFDPATKTYAAAADAAAPTAYVGYRLNATTVALRSN